MCTFLFTVFGYEREYLHRESDGY
uniref:Uncharacterized protein n=1 Tax=Rhizophora mucronata TaxID=61149 RepID=A0A2P2NFH4_RHIMU